MPPLGDKQIEPGGAWVIRQVLNLCAHIPRLSYIISLSILGPISLYECLGSFIG